MDADAIVVTAAILDIFLVGGECPVLDCLDFFLFTCPGITNNIQLEEHLLSVLPFVRNYS